MSALLESEGISQTPLQLEKAPKELPDFDIADPKAGLNTIDTNSEQPVSDQKPAKLAWDPNKNPEFGVSGLEDDQEI